MSNTHDDKDFIAELDNNSLQVKLLPNAEVNHIETSENMATINISTRVNTMNNDMRVLKHEPIFVHRPLDLNKVIFRPNLRKPHRKARTRRLRQDDMDAKTNTPIRSEEYTAPIQYDIMQNTTNFGPLNTDKDEILLEEFLTQTIKDNDTYLFEEKARPDIKNEIPLYTNKEELIDMNVGWNNEPDCPPELQKNNSLEGGGIIEPPNIPSENFNFHIQHWYCNAIDFNTVKELEITLKNLEQNSPRSFHLISA